MADKGKPDRKAADARKAQRERDAEAARELQEDLDKVRAEARIPARKWWGRRS